MKRTAVAKLVNATTIALLLSASVAFHLQRVLHTNNRTVSLANIGLSFPGSVCCATLLSSFPSMLLMKENSSHHKPT
jgi:hypothetical protein